VVVRDDFWASTSNKQLNFVQHVKTLLAVNGRAAVVVPDNVLFEGGAGETVRRKLLHECDVHTLLRLPTGVFYAQGVKANVLFFDKVGQHASNGTKDVWVYDLRANMPRFGKRTPLTHNHFAEFEAAFAGPRQDQGETGRFRCFSRDWIRDRADSLDIAWLKDDNAEDTANLPEPSVLAQEAIGELEGALTELQAILAELGEVAG